MRKNNVLNIFLQTIRNLPEFCYNISKKYLIINNFLQFTLLTQEVIPVKTGIHMLLSP